jgi:SAM-dependent methyltransferase
MNSRAESQTSVELERIYSIRFSGLEEYRKQVWSALVSQFFSRWLSKEHAVLDLGCGYGEFINNLTVREKFAMDLNPTAKERVAPEVKLIHQDCSKPWPLHDNYLDVIFTSNFFEHLPSKLSLQETLLEAYRCLRPNGRLIVLGPNVKYLSGAYWDFFDHHLPLTELSVEEAMVMAGFKVEQRIAKFLPYTMSQGLRPPIWMLRLYLKMPFVWKYFGKQFLVVARK